MTNSILHLTLCILVTITFIILMLSIFSMIRYHIKKKNDFKVNNQWIDPLENIHESLYEMYFENEKINEETIKRNKIIKFPLLKNK